LCFCTAELADDGLLAQEEQQMNRFPKRQMKPLVLSLALTVGACGADVTPDLEDDAASLCGRPATRTAFFGLSKAKSNDKEAQQQRGYEAVQRIAAASANVGVTGIELLQEPVPTTVAPFVVGETRVRSALSSLAKSLGSDDTVIIYSHTHGIADRRSTLGGLIVTDPSVLDGQPDWLDWSEYAESLLALPAKNVVVLTMSCFSGGLVAYLNRPSVKARWSRRRVEGRSFLVITSQSGDRLSNPRRIDGELINPFTHTLEKALGWQDIDRCCGGRSSSPDGTITFDEFIRYLVSRTQSHTDDRDPENDPLPQVAGSYRPHAPLFTWRSPRCSRPVAACGDAEGTQQQQDADRCLPRNSARGSAQEASPVR
jgi:hypothetical protein